MFYIMYTITTLKTALRAFLTSKEIDTLIRETRTLRKWQSKHFENQFVKRRLQAILLTYSR